MKLFQHRVNTVQAYQDVNTNLVSGIECDIRYHLGNPYLNHDISKTFDSIDFLHRLIPMYVNPYIILNFKETGGEINLLERISDNISSCLLLDIPFPVVVQAYKSGYGKSVMWRMSEYERPSLNLINELDGKWIWLDSFHSYWFDNKLLEKLKDNGFLICLVSNELQKRQLEVGLDKVVDASSNGLIDAICTKNPEKYAEILSI